MSIEKLRGTLLPPIAKLSTRARECIPPCQVLATFQCVMPCGGLNSPLSISVCTGWVSRPLTTLLEDREALSCILTAVDMIWILSCVWVEVRLGSFQHPHRSQGSERLVDTAELCVGRQARQSAGEMGMPHAREDVLEAVRLQYRLLHHAGLGRAQLPPASSSKVIAIGSGLRLD